MAKITPSLADRVVATANRHRDDVAVTAQDGTLSYQELAEQAAAVAAGLRSRGQGLGPEDLVGICMDRSATALVAMLGVLISGAAYVPLDPQSPGRNKQVLSDAQPRVVIAGASYRRRIPAGPWDVLVPDGTRHAAPQPIPSAGGSSLAYVMFTSGSTGRPKGIAIEHRSLANFIDWHQATFALQPGDRVSQFSSLTFDASVFEIWPALCAGATVCIVPASVRPFAVAAARWLVANAIDLAYLPARLVEDLVDWKWPEGTSLRWLLTGGEQLTRRPAASFPCALINAYGPTEATVIATVGIVATAEEGDGRPSIGRPLPNVATLVLSEDGKPVAPGTPGELYIAGAGLARGYINNPAENRARFVNLVLEGERIRAFRSGDQVVAAADGSLTFIGRLDRQVKMHGVRVELGEIEATLERHPDVRRAALTWSQSVQKLTAYVVAGATTSVSELRAHVSSRLPPVMVPGEFHIVADLPLTVQGKVDYAQLADGEEDDH